MKNVLTTEKKPIKLWLDDLEDLALAQAKNLANLPFTFSHVALMPDAHMGFGMPIGGVVATHGVVIPNAVGSDVGCGVCAVRTSLTDINLEDLKKTMSKIREHIPLGMNHHLKEQADKWMPARIHGNDLLDSLHFSSLKQIGTLGGGNHFIELQKGSDNFVWIMLHSGSRNLGFQVAKYYNSLAIELNEKWFSEVPTTWQLSFLPLDTKEGMAYMEAMSYCVEFARRNRLLMMARIQDIIVDTCKNVEFGAMLNIAHNYAEMEHHFGRNVVVHRKGATKAYAGQLGIIPGSQGTSSYIVKGLGNRDSFMSCSHGAGRKMGRKRAQKELVLLDEIKRLDELGVVHSIRTVDDLDEAPGAYKDITTVMENQKDLVEIVVELKPLAVVKG